MAPSRKRRSDQRDPSEDNSSDASPPRRRRRSSSSSPAASVSSETQTNSISASSTTTLAKKLIRLALSTEYARTPLRRTDISTKVLASTPSNRNFKQIFAFAQSELQSKFGMQLVELPSREKTSLKDRRALASQAKISATSSKSWILVSTLPAPYKTNPAICTPTQANGGHDTEASYTALYTFVVSVIMLNNGTLPDAKLERYLKRVNAETYTSVGATEKVLARMIKEGYVEKRRNTSFTEDVVEWTVGPRGKVEVGVDGVRGLVRGVYGFNDKDDNGDAGEEEEELERKVKRSLGIKDQRARIVVDGGGEEEGSDAEAVETVANAPRRTRGGPKKAAPAASSRRREAEDSDDDDDDDDDG